jgi:L,D-peptidoglycan transpeptidase YkuD (ErfK/YbiS/YcfS/YnhG family)
MKQVTCAILFFGVSLASAAKQHDVSANCRQCLVVITDSWTTTGGKMWLFERNDNSPWRQRQSQIPVLVGRAGLGWGRGVLETSSFPGPIKKEGDDKAPAGIFQLQSVFGKSGDRGAIRMPYLALSKNVVAVDDPRSRYYNQIVDRSKIVKPDWLSAEKMFGVTVYKWGVVVGHNMVAKPGAGSCVFLHIWENSLTPTSGCTAMSENDLVDLVHWLDPARHPLLVQMPRSSYNVLRSKWNLPGGATY